MKNLNDWSTPFKKLMSKLECPNCGNQFGKDLQKALTGDRIVTGTGNCNKYAECPECQYVGCSDSTDVRRRNRRI